MPKKSNLPDRTFLQGRLPAHAMDDLRAFLAQEGNKAVIQTQAQFFDRVLSGFLNNAIGLAADKVIWRRPSFLRGASGFVQVNAQVSVNTAAAVHGYLLEVSSAAGVEHKPSMAAFIFTAWAWFVGLSEQQKATLLGTPALLAFTPKDPFVELRLVIPLSSAKAALRLMGHHGDVDALEAGSELRTTLMSAPAALAAQATA